MGPTTVMVVEDDPVTRERITAAIRADSRLKLLAAVGSCADAEQELGRATPRVLLVDLGLPDGDGTEIIGAAAVTGATDIMVLTVFADERHVVAALEAGATGYLLKDSANEDIAEAIVRLIEGESPISPKIARYLVRRMQPAKAAVNAGPLEGVLTSRELEVLENIAKGFSYSEIAKLLSISPQTVPSHIKSIYRKLAVHSRSEAVFEAENLGLIRLHH